MGIRNRSCSCTIFRPPLISACWTLCQFPLETKKIIKIIIIPSCWCSCPCSLKTTGNRILCIPFSKTVFPTKALLFNTSSSWFRSNIFTRISSTMRLPKSMTASNKRNSLFIIHGHATECFTNVTCRSNWIRFAIRPLRININQPHLNSSKWIFKIAVACITLIAQPFTL